MSRWLTWTLLIIAAGALALRVPQLDRRPLHTDESVHTIKFKGLWDHGTYRYDPNEYHGPSLYYLTLPFVRLSGAATFADTQIVPYRLVPAVFGIGLVLLLLLMRDALGRTGTVLAALMMALSPAMVFYSRYYIHELLLVFFSGLVLAAGWRYSRRPDYLWAVLIGLGVGMMYATKETFVISLGAMVMAMGLAWAWGTFMDGYSFEWREHFKPAHLLTALATAVVVGLLFFSSFFTNAAGPLDSLRTYLPWLGRAQGNSAHIHPWYYYLDLLAWKQQGRGPIFSEALVLGLALAGFFVSLRRIPLSWRSESEHADAEEYELFGQAPANPNPVWFRFVAFYTLIMTVAYAAIPYKTPWCLLGFYHGMILLAAMGFATLWRACPSRWQKMAILLPITAALGQLGWQAYRTNFVYYADQRNPYVYAHTSTDITRLTRKVESLAKLHPDGRKILVRVIAKGGDYWPLPWYLRAFDRIGWYPGVPDDPRAPVIIVSPEMEPALSARLGTNYQNAGYFGHRPKVFLELLVQNDLWQRYVASPKTDEED